MTVKNSVIPMVGVLATQVSTGLQMAQRSYTRGRSSALRRYADWRVGARPEEKFAHKSSDSILLTFDDYGTKAQVDRLLGIFASEDVRAMFFVQGDWAEENSCLVEAIADAGHIVGNHTYSHPNLLELSDDEVRTEIAKGPESSWLRPPMGRYNARIRRIAAEFSAKITYWSIDSDDWKGVSADYIHDKVLRELHPGAVILFHIHADNTAAVLPRLIADIRQRGYKLTSLDEPVLESRYATSN